MSILSVSVGISLYAEKGGGLFEPTLLSVERVRRPRQNAK